MFCSIDKHKKRKQVHEASFLSYLNVEQRIVRFSVMNKGDASLSVRTQKTFGQCLQLDLFRSTTKSKMCGFHFLCRTSLPKAGVLQCVDKKLFAQIFRYLTFGNFFPLPCHYRRNRTEYNKKSSRISTASFD